MRYFKVQLGKDTAKEVIPKLDALDHALAKRAAVNRGVDVMSLIGAGKPYLDEYGAKRWATTPEVQRSIRKLVKLGILQERGG